MLYKVTPMIEPVAAKAERPARKKRKSVVFDADGNEVLISLMCLKCRTVKPLAQFGLRKMADGAVRNQPWCRGCRGAATPKKEKAGVLAEAAPLPSAPPVPVGQALIPVAAEGSAALIAQPPPLGWVHEPAPGLAVEPPPASQPEEATVSGVVPAIPLPAE